MPEGRVETGSGLGVCCRARKSRKLAKVEFGKEGRKGEGLVCVQIFSEGMTHL